MNLKNTVLVRDKHTNGFIALFLNLVTMINIFVLCKNDNFFCMLEGLFEDSGIAIAGACKEPQNAVEHFIKSKADVVVMDANWSSSIYTISAKQIMRNFLEHDKNIKVIFVTLYNEPKYIQDIKALGAKGYIYRTVNKFEKITNCIRGVYSGDAVYTP